MTRNAITFTRQELYERVWSTPLSTLCAKFGISDRGLAKLCKRMEIPLPGRGYWRRVECKRKTNKPVLLPLSAKGKPAATFNNDEQKRAKIPKVDVKIAVPDTLQNPHPLVKLTRSIARELHVAKGGYFYLGNNQGLNIRCSAGTLKRSLCILDALIKTLAADGIPVEVNDKGKTVAICALQKIEFLIEERSSRTQSINKNGYTQTQYSPTGCLAFRIEESLSEGFRRNWADGKRQKLENCVSEIISVIKFIGPKKAEAEARWEENRRANEAAEKIRREERERERTLHEQIIEWGQVKELREYLAALKCERADQSEDREFWISWIEAYTNLVDPVNPKRRGKPFRLFNLGF